MNATRHAVRGPLSGIVLPLIALAGCAMPAPVPSGPDGQQQLLIREDELAEALASKQPERYAVFLTEDAVFIPADGDMSIGRDAVVESWAPFFEDQELELERTPIQAETSIDLSLGYTLGTWRLSRSGTSGSQLVETGRYTTIWRRDMAGNWRVATDIGNDDHAPVPDLTF